MIDPTLSQDEANQAAYLLIREWLARDGATKCGYADEHENGDPYFKCLYADGQGNHCAIGGPMRDILTPAMIEENPTASALVLGMNQWGGKAQEFWGPSHPQFLDEAQACHDDVKAGDDWQAGALSRLDQLAKDWNLTVPVAS